MIISFRRIIISRKKESLFLFFYILFRFDEILIRLNEILTKRIIR